MTATAPRATKSREVVIRVIVIAALICGSANQAFAQSASPTPAAQAVVPETGFVADDRYTNAFFGFLLPLPKDAWLGQGAYLPEVEKTLAKVPLRHVLYLVQSRGFDGTILAVIADECRGASVEDAKKALPDVRPPESLQIGGKQFWKNRYVEEKVEGPLPFLPPSRSPLRSYRYATALNGYVLEIDVFSDRSDVLNDYVRRIYWLGFGLVSDTPSDLETLRKLRVTFPSPSP